MRVCDYELDYSHGGVFTCCESHIMEDKRKAHENMKIECEDCGASMTLRKCSDNVLRWQAS